MEPREVSPIRKQRSRLDPNAIQTTSQNILSLCKRMKTSQSFHFCFSLSAKRLSEVLSSPRQSLRIAADSSFKKVLPGVVVTSSRSSRRRISSAAATQAFAVATSGESPKGFRNERLASNPGKSLRFSVIFF